MCARAARVLGLALVLPAVLAATAQARQVSGGFVEGASAVGLDHFFQSGLDQMGTTLVRDFVQSGMAVGDIDGDGDLDVVACGGLAPSSIFRNDGGTFTDVTASSEINVGELDRAPALGDYDGDGDLDLFLGALERGLGDGAPRGRLFRNDGTGVFTEVTALGGPFGRGRTVFAQWGDLDMDGLLDLYVSEFHGAVNSWYRNNGDGGFTEMAAALGIDYGGNTHVSAIGDVDLDGLQDLLVGSDWFVGVWTGTPTNEPDAQFQGRPDHTLLDVSDGSGYKQYQGIMGLALGDVDYDGDLDVYKTDVKKNWMMINSGWPASEAVWSDVAYIYGIANTWVPDPGGGFGKSVGWTAAFFNADADPWLDLLVVNGKVAGLSATVAYAPGMQPNYLFHGDGPASGNTFTDRSLEFGLTDAVDDRGASLGDLDGDGDVDLLVSPVFGPLRYYENQVDPEGQGWVRVRPECRTSAPGGFGVLARWTDSLGYPHVRIVGGDGPTASQHENVAHFAIGAEPAIDLSVEFPSGIVLDFPQVPPNTEVVAVEPELIRLPDRTVAVPHPGFSMGVDGGVAIGHLAAKPYPVTAFAHDASGQPLDGAASVSIEMPGLQPAGPVKHVAGNEFVRSFRPPGKPGTFRVETAFDGFSVRIEPQVHFYDFLDVSETIVEVRPEAVRAGSADTFRVVVCPRAAGGIRHEPVRELTVDVPGATLLGTPASPAEGIFVFEFSAPTATGIHAVNVVVDQAPILAGATIEAGGPAGPDNVVVYIEKPVEVQSAAPHQMKLAVQPRDVDDFRLGPYAAIELVPIADPGTPDVTVLALHPTGQRDGEYVFIAEKPVGTPDDGATGIVQITVDGVVVTPTTYSF